MNEIHASIIALQIWALSNKATCENSEIQKH